MKIKKNKIKTIGSVCSGIEAATVAWKPLGYEFKWYSEIETFPSSVLSTHFPETKNLGDMTNLPNKILNNFIKSPDLICGGTPCQAFSYTGFRTGLKDDRGNLTLKFIDIINANDSIRLKKGEARTIIFWENVEGVLSDNTNAFGLFISLLSGLEKPILKDKWPKSGILRGPIRNIAWRVIDSKYYGLPQQRKRLYLLAGGKDFSPEKVLFEETISNSTPSKKYTEETLSFNKNGHEFEVFREYTDCLYAAYGTKWNGNAAANNGSLFVVQDGRIRRFSPLECERLMGFPDNYTNIPKSKRTQRYTAIGNSWTVPVIQWIGSRLTYGFNGDINFSDQQQNLFSLLDKEESEYEFKGFETELIYTSEGSYNCSTIPENPKYGTLKNIVSPEQIDEKLYLSPTACYGIIRRGKNRVNPRLKQILEEISSQISIEEIEKKSRRQPRGEQSGMAKLMKKIKKQS